MNRHLFKAMVFVCILLVLPVTHIFLNLHKIKSFNLRYNEDDVIEIPLKEDELIEVFVGGAVENEGYYDISFFSTYKQIFKIAKPRINAKIENVDKYIEFKDLIILENGKYRLVVYVDYYENNELKYAVNISTCTFIQLIENGFDENISRKIIDNRQEKSYNNKAELVSLQILTSDEFEWIKYKIYAYKGDN